MSCNGNCNQGRNCNCGGLHVMPLNDLREHELNRSCWCRPTYDEEDNLIIHNSLDCREQFERHERKPS